ncbi:hypothetical protein PR003_g32991, partial [Phytophthora rubi]
MKLTDTTVFWCPLALFVASLTHGSLFSTKSRRLRKCGRRPSRRSTSLLFKLPSLHELSCRPTRVLRRLHSRVHCSKHGCDE